MEGGGGGGGGGGPNSGSGGWKDDEEQEGEDDEQQDDDDGIGSLPVDDEGEISGGELAGKNAATSERSASSATPAVLSLAAPAVPPRARTAAAPAPTGDELIFHGGSLRVKVAVRHVVGDPARTVRGVYGVYGVEAPMINPPRDAPDADPMPPWDVSLSITVSVSGAGRGHVAKAYALLHGTRGTATATLANARVAITATATASGQGSTAIAEAYGITTAARHEGSTSTVSAVADAAITSTTEIP